MNQVRSETYKGSELIELLRKHIPSDFDPDEFVIAGSGRLWADDIIPRLSDLDLLVRPQSGTWDRAMELAADHARGFQEQGFKTVPFRLSTFTNDVIARLYGGVVEVCQTWLLPGSNTEDLLATADVIDGLRYLPLSEVIAYKRWLNREKDRADLAAIEARDRTGKGLPTTPLPARCAVAN